jgi:bifunctional non-homologous end joining protein LigD
MKYIRIEGGSKLGEYISPMLATLSDEAAFDNPAWLFEIKWDGYRALAELKGGNTRFYSRNGLTFIKAYPKVFDALVKIKRNAVIDGEVVVYDQTGKPSFQSIQNYNSRQALAIQFQAFDCLEVDGEDVTKRTLLERKQILKEILPASDVIKFCDHIVGDGKMLYEHASNIGLEGIIAKKSNSKYFIGKRSKDWLKIKNVFTDDFVIVGWTDPQKSRQYFGALIIARLDKGKLVHAGDVGTGFTDRMLKELYEKLKAIERRKSPMSMPVKETKDMHWVEPHFIAQVQYTEITQDGHVRHPSFLGLRMDK